MRSLVAAARELWLVAAATVVATCGATGSTDAQVYASTKLTDPWTITLCLHRGLNCIDSYPTCIQRHEDADGDEFPDECALGECPADTVRVAASQTNQIA
jgi:hypothetical protein